MKADRVVAAMIVATAILVTPNILTNLVLVLRLNVRRMEEILVDELPAKERQVQRQTMSPRCMMSSKVVLKVLQGGTTGFATEDEIRECFIEVGYTGAGDDNDNYEEENTNNLTQD